MAAVDDSEYDESLQAALADLEMLQSAYSDEIDRYEAKASSLFPLTVTLRFSSTASCRLQWRAGYPTTTNIEIASSRAKDSAEQQQLERALRAIRTTAAQCLEDGIEGGLACCAAAMEAWNDGHRNEEGDDEKPPYSAVTPQEYDKHITQNSFSEGTQQCVANCSWISGEPLLDRKSTFQAHMCPVRSEHEVAQALQQLLTSSSKMQRATHHMYAYRFTETRENGNGAGDGDVGTARARTTIVKHDNSDDGEDGAGARLAHLLQMRQDDGVLVVVSRWYGGIHLGPKRFAHITNVARELLVQQQEQSKNDDGNSKKKFGSSTIRDKTGKR